MKILICGLPGAGKTTLGRPFEELLGRLKEQFIGLLLNIKIVSDDYNNEKKPKVSDNPKCLIILKKGEKISRNEVCPATNKKYKNCCGSL